jgi:phage shock protein PspC (stress-responsive transcriptional regulator)
MTQIPGPAAGPTQHHDRANGMDRFFDWLRSLDLRRDTEDKWLAGVCSGIANRLGIDPIVVRAGLVLLVLLGGVGITLYLIAWALVPNERQEIVAERAVRQGEVMPIILLVVIGLSLLGSTGFAHDTPGAVWFWWIAVPVAVVVWVVTRNRKATPVAATGSPSPTPPGATQASGYGTSAPAAHGASTLAAYGASAPATYGVSTAPYGGTTQAPHDLPPAGYSAGPTTPPYAGGPWSGAPVPPTPVAPRPARVPRPPKPPRRRSAGFIGTLLVSGIALAAYGLTLWLHDANHWAGSGETVALGAALAVFGVGILGFGIAGRRAGLTGLIAIVLAIVTWSASVIPDLHFGGGIGDRVWRPTAAQVTPDYRLGIGSAKLDLSSLPANPSVPRQVDARVGVGELRILVPSNLTVEVKSSVGAGDINRVDDPFGDASSSSNSTSAPTDELIGPNKTPDVVVTAHVGLGQILIGKE